MKKKSSTVKQNPRGKEVTEESFRKSLSEYQAVRNSILYNQKNKNKDYETQNPEVHS